MNIDLLPEEFPPSNVDVKRKEVSHISAWIDKEEFVHVFNLIFSSNKSDVNPKETALKSLKVWKIRKNKQTPVSVLCTLAILEVQIYDTRSQLDGKDNASEVKSLYSGAFTRFINHLTECHQQSGAGRKGSMANRVKEIGIEGFLVELRHLCAHTSVSISIDVFRRSADYCMNWLKVSYWKRELQLMQSCEARQIKGGTLGKKLDDDLRYIVKIYDITTKALHKGAKSMSGAEKELTPSQFLLLQEHARANKADQLNTVAFDIVRYISETMKLPKCSETIQAVCGALLDCQFMFEAPVKGSIQGLVHIHQYLFQMLVMKGYIQTYLEKLIAICEDDQESSERRRGAKFWANEIALAFRLLKRFKKVLKAQPERSHQFNRRESTKKMSKTVRAIYQNKLRVDLQNTLIIGVSVNCPWHLRLSRSYLVERTLNVNEYTKELLPAILGLAEPHLKLSQRETIEAAVEKYTINYLASIENENVHPEQMSGSGKTSTPRRSTVHPRKQDLSQVYSLQDVLRKRKCSDTEQPSPPGAGDKKARQFGVWTEMPSDGLDWGKCPLGKLVWD